MTSMDAILQAKLDQRHQQFLYRHRTHVASGCDAVLQVDGKSLVNFCSNDYFGLAGHPDIAAALKAGVDQYGTGSGASHLISGHSTAHQHLEEQLERVKQQLEDTQMELTVKEKELKKI